MSKNTAQVTPKFPRGTVRKAKFSVVLKMHDNPFPGQRSHQGHLQEVAFLRRKTPLCGPQQTFAVVEYPHPQSGVLVKQLLDGYTRIEAVKQKVMRPPEDGFVNIETYKVRSFEEAKELYNWFNNTATGKRSKHEVQSAVRTCTNNASDKFVSHLLSTGPFVSALSHSGLLAKSVFDRVVEGFESFQTLDALRLRRTHETSGLLAAYLALIHFEPDQASARSFICKMNQAVFVADPQYGEDKFVQYGRAYHEDMVKARQASCKANVDDIRDHILQRFTEFRLTRNGKAVPAWVRNLTLGTYCHDADKRRKAA